VITQEENHVIMQPIERPEYWQDEFEVTEADLEMLYERFVNEEVPRPTAALVRDIVERRVERAERQRTAQADVNGVLYQPKESYDVGQRLVFPALGEDVTGEITEVRAGKNAEYGAFTVIQVKLDGNGTREFASEFPEPHILNVEDTPVSAENLYDTYGPIVREHLLAALAENSEFVRYGDAWILKGLLPEVHIGHRNIAEAMIVVADEALPTERILEEIDLADDLPLETRKLALNRALSQDDRFINVGAITEPLWALSYQREA
jgi:hypothetical protein